MVDKAPTFSQKTAVALAELYASRFGRIYNSMFIQRKAENNELAAFLFKLDLDESLRRKALSYVSPKEVREFILSYFYSGKALLDVEEYTQEDELEEFREGVTWLLSEAILNEMQSVWSNASEPLREKGLTLLLSLEADGYFFYKQKLLTSQQLLDEFGVWFNAETRKFIDMQGSNQSAESRVVTAQEFLLSVPLYKIYELETDSLARLLYDLGREHLTVDSHCIECGRSSTFKRTIPYFHNAHLSPKGSYYEVTLLCTRESEHRMKFYVRVDKNSVVKVGQYPSVADLVQTGVKKYRKVLGDRYTEFARAIGLAAHGVGVGSFVYLRRIFEDLITKAYESANKDADWQRNNAAGFVEKRMNEKIQMLRDHLPPFLVQNRDMYGILSKGVHDLTEQECLEYFPVVQKGIELILDDEIERLERKAKTADTQKAIDAIRSKIANKATDV